MVTAVFILVWFLSVIIFNIVNSISKKTEDNVIYALMDDSIEGNDIFSPDNGSKTQKAQAKSKKWNKRLNVTALGFLIVSLLTFLSYIIEYVILG